MIRFFSHMSSDSVSRSTTSKFFKFDRRLPLHFTYSERASFSVKCPDCKYVVIQCGFTGNFLNASVFVEYQTPPNLRNL